MSADDKQRILQSEIELDVHQPPLTWEQRKQRGAQEFEAFLQAPVIALRINPPTDLQCVAVSSVATGEELAGAVPGNSPRKQSPQQADDGNEQRPDADNVSTGSSSSSSSSWSYHTDEHPLPIWRRTLQYSDIELFIKASSAGDGINQFSIPKIVLFGAQNPNALNEFARWLLLAAFPFETICVYDPRWNQPNGLGKLNRAQSGPSSSHSLTCHFE